MQNIAQPNNIGKSDASNWFTILVGRMPEFSREKTIFLHQRNYFLECRNLSL